ncbi:MAG: hypothetical protein P4L73_14870 [Caulobacteraceae bacterium]|nr:hypothetical protein [Caulobacteraceae bacterium]
MNYKRPQNIQAITAAARAGLPDAPIFVLDQAERPEDRWRDDDAAAGVWVHRSKVNAGAGARVPLASRLPFDFYVAIDDDIFLQPAQIARLAAIVRSAPGRAHGVWGERLELNDGAVASNGFRTRVDIGVSMLNRVYAFSRAQAAGALALAQKLGFAAWADVGPTDDILLSCGGLNPPRCHDLGEFGECPTSNTPGVAVWKSQGFTNRRVDVVTRLIDAKAIAVYRPA